MKNLSESLFCVMTIVLSTGKLQVVAIELLVLLGVTTVLLSKAGLMGM